jgi:HPt (histidine-containing phosphotransfer) domain-containing protein
MTQNNQKVTNLNYLNDLAKGNDKFVREMIRIFLEENPAEILTLEEGIGEGNFQQIRACAHKLRSTIPFVGLETYIEEEISEMENIAYENREVNGKHNFNEAQRMALATIERLFEKVKTVCSKAREELS